MVNTTTTPITGNPYGAFPDGLDSGGVVSLTGSTTITKADHKDRILKLDGTGAAYTQTLPAATGSGDKYTFVVGATNTSNHIIEASTNGGVFYGNIITNSTGDTPDLGQPWRASGEDTITLNGTTKGGLIGDKLEFIDVASNTWIVQGVTTSSGTEATPLS